MAEIAIHWQQTFDTCVTRNAGHVHPSTKMNCTLRLSSKAWLASGISASARHRYLLMSEMQWIVTRLFPAALVFPCWIWSSVQRSWAKLCGLWPSCGEDLKLDLQIVYLYYTYISFICVCDVYMLLIDIDWHWYWLLLTVFIGLMSQQPFPHHSIFQLELR